MRRTPNQIRISWETQSTPTMKEKQEDALSEDPMLDAVNDLLFMYDLFEGDDFAQERIVKYVRQEATSWEKYFDHCALEQLKGDA